MLGTRNASCHLPKTGSPHQGFSLGVRGPQRRNLNEDQRLLEDGGSQQERYRPHPGRAGWKGSPRDSHRSSQEGERPLPHQPGSETQCQEQWVKKCPLSLPHLDRLKRWARWEY